MMIRIALILLSSVILVGCFDGPRLYRENWQQSYRFQELMYFHGGKDMRVDVNGVPAGMRGETYVSDLLNSMYGSHHGQPIRFTQTPEQTAGAPTRLIVQASLPENVRGASLCEENVEIGKATRVLTFVYCKRDRELSSLRLFLPQGVEPGSAQFSKAVALATNQLLPIVDPYNKSESCLVDC